MSEQEQRSGSQLVSERGVTTISDGVVSRIAGIAAGEVDGIHMGGGASRGAGGIFDRVTGSGGQTRGISVEVGRTEVAIDLTVGIDYGRNILERTGLLRRRITEDVQRMTGLRVSELNVRIDDIVFPEGEDGHEERPGLAAGEDETREWRAGSPGGEEDETAELRAAEERGEGRRIR
jgi:uncharacterized alkaline shock family protein YloU